MVVTDQPILVVAEGTFAELTDIKKRFRQEAIVEERDIGIDADSIVAAVDGAHGLAVALHPLKAEHFEALAGRIQVVGRAGIGLDSIDLDAASLAGIAVVHQPEYATAEVATHAVAMLLSLQRRLKEADDLARPLWQGRKHLSSIFALDEAAVGVIGCGRIGSAVIERLRLFAGEIIVYDPFVDSVPEDTRRVEDLMQLMAECRAVTIHAPLVTETRNLIGSEALAAMAPGSILVNVSRGGIVDEDALAKALESGHLGGAGLDVLTQEPPPTNHRLFDAPNLLLSAHIAWYSEASERRLKHQTIADMISYLNGAPLLGRLAVDPQGDQK